MRVRVGEIRSLIETAIQEEKDRCNVYFKEGETLELHRPVRVIPTEKGYFGGEVTGSRNRGTTAATLQPGTMCKVVKRISANTAWVRCRELKEPIRVDINKFCPDRADRYLSAKKKSTVAQSGPPKIPATPEERYRRAQEEYHNAIIALRRAKKNLEAAQAEFEKEDEWADDTNPGVEPSFN